MEVCCVRRRYIMRARFLAVVFTAVLVVNNAFTVDAAYLNAENISIPVVAVSVGQTTAEKSARQYLKVMPFSRQGLIDQLSSLHGSGFSVEEATEAVDMLEQDGLVDWNEEAIKYAKRYIDLKPFSRQGLLRQLSSKYGAQFTDEQSEVAVAYLEENDLVDWNEEAIEAAENYLSVYAFSRQELYGQLTSAYGSAFTVEEAKNALTELGY